METVSGLLLRLQKAIAQQAQRHCAAVMPGYTHLQPAQPILFSHHLLAYAWMFQRDRERMADCARRAAKLPLGSAALAGTSFPIDRRYTAKLLGFPDVTENSIDSVSDRDFAIEFTAVASLIAMHLSRLAEELVIWSSAQFRFVRLAEEYTSGSSIMPQKRNPDVAEIIRGKTGRMYGDLFALLTLMKGIPLAYNRDMQEDKPPLFDSVDSVRSCLEVMGGMIETMTVNADTMRRATERGFLSATELADYLARKKIPFRTAHGKVKEIVSYCVKRGKTLEELSVAELKGFHSDFDADIKTFLSLDHIVRAKRSEGGTAPASVKVQLRKLKGLLR